MHVHLEILHHEPVGSRRPGPPLLFVHGAFLSARCWEKHFMPWFAARGYDVWAMSFRGHGESSGKEYLSLASLDHYRHDLSQCVAQMPSTPILIGHGMGGLVIQQWLHEHRAPAVAMLASVPPIAGMCSMLQLAMTTPRTLIELNQVHCSGDNDARLREIHDIMFSRNTPTQLVSDCLPCFQAESHRALVDLSVVCFNPLPPELRPEILMIAAERDALLPHHLVHAAAAHCGINACTIADIGHALMLEKNWEAVAIKLASWLEKLDVKIPPPLPLPT